ncbi:Protein NHR-16 [Aphelenchoides avenae]|nr:Protein NHR-16 [Aphelenchus avenae]
MRKQENRTARAVKLELNDDRPPTADPSTSSDTKLLKCDVCGGRCFTKNFGANACRACAAFFRRAVSGRRNYRCKALTSCRQDGFHDCKPFSTIRLIRTKHLVRTFPACKCCRFRRCIKVGMQITGVAFSVPTPVSATSSESTFLERHAAYRNTLFLRRIRFLTDDGDCPLRFQTTTKTLGDRITRAELEVLKEFFSSFDDVWRFLRRDATREELVEHYFAAYALLEIVLTTSRNLGYRRNVIFTTVETCHSTTADDIAKDYNAWYFGLNIGTIARYDPIQRR